MTNFVLVGTKISVIEALQYSIMSIFIVFFILISLSLSIKLLELVKNKKSNVEEVLDNVIENVVENDEEERNVAVLVASILARKKYGKDVVVTKVTRLN